MSRVPSELPLERLIKSVETSSASLGEKATALSSVIEDIDARLRDMPGKLAGAVSDSDSEVRLSFQKLHGRWGLWVQDDDSSYDPESGRIPEGLWEVSIARKARAFPLLPALLGEIDEQQREHVRQIDSALHSLNSQGGK